MRQPRSNLRIEERRVGGIEDGVKKSDRAQPDAAPCGRSAYPDGTATATRFRKEIGKRTGKADLERGPSGRSGGRSLDSRCDPQSFAHPIPNGLYALFVSTSTTSFVPLAFTRWSCSVTAVGLLV